MTIPGLSHADLLAAKLPDELDLIRNLVGQGTLVTLAGLPESYKSWLSTEFACKTAAGGLILGRFEVVTPGPVAVFFADDSSKNEIARVQAYSNANSFTGPLPITWHLNPSVRIPDDFAAVAETLKANGCVLSIFDSFYNFAQGNLRDEDSTYAGLKREICDATGCSVLVVDHSPWPSESNRGGHRPYGSVFKKAAARTTLHLARTKDGAKLDVRGNNYPSDTVSLIWNPRSLSLQPGSQAEDELERRLRDYLVANPGATANRATIDLKASRRDVYRLHKRIVAEGVPDA